MVGEEQLEDPVRPTVPRVAAPVRGLRRLLWIAPLIALAAVIVTKVGFVATGLDNFASRHRIAHRWVPYVSHLSWPARIGITLGSSCWPS